MKKYEVTVCEYCDDGPCFRTCWNDAKECAIDCGADKETIDDDLYTATISVLEENR